MNDFHIWRSRVNMYVCYYTYIFSIQTRDINNHIYIYMNQKLKKCSVFFSMLIFLNIILMIIVIVMFLIYLLIIC